MRDLQGSLKPKEIGEKITWLTICVLRPFLRLDLDVTSLLLIINLCWCKISRQNIPSLFVMVLNAQIVLKGSVQ